MARIRGVLLDGVGTTLHPVDDVAQTYADFGLRHGSKLLPEAIYDLFRQAFQVQEQFDQTQGHVTSEPRERARWSTIVREVFVDVYDTEPLFQELWNHYALPSSWRLYDEVPSVFEELRRYGARIVLASNFDSRLRVVLDGLDLLRELSALVISSEVGCKKPSVAFFSHALSTLQCSPQEVVAIGDHRRNDYEGAKAAGMVSFLLDRDGKARAPYVISNLQAVIPFLGRSAPPIRR